MMIIVQARMESTRLPGKVMLELGGAPVLHWVLSAALAADEGPVILALPDTKANDDIADSIGDPFIVTRGPLEDVADRFRRIVQNHDDIFVRLCADSPFIDPLTIRNTVRTLRLSDAAYCRGGDSGRTAQAVRVAPWLQALEDMTDAEREHVIPEWFGPKIEAAPLTLDTQDDYERLKELL